MTNHEADAPLLGGRFRCDRLLKEGLGIQTWLATDLARLLSSQGQGAAARRALAPVYASFTEGFFDRNYIRARMMHFRSLRQDEAQERIPFVLPLAKRFGLRAMVIFGTFMMALQYPLSAEVSGLDWALFARNATAAVGEAFYWTCFHAYFATLGDAEYRGHQIGAREALAQGIAIVAPLLGAWALESLGPHWMFTAVGVVQALAVMPLLGLPAFSDPGAPIHAHVAPRYLADSIKDTHVPNVVTSVLATAFISSASSRARSVTTPSCSPILNPTVPVSVRMAWPGS